MPLSTLEVAAARCTFAKGYINDYKIGYMKYFVILFFLAVSNLGTAQSNRKTENVFIITLDGYRWQELFTGADLTLIQNKTFTEDSAGMMAQFWKDSPLERRRILMPFFWNTIASQGQLYGNRAYNNNVNCSNTMWFSYPGYSEILCGFADDERINSNKKIDNPNTTILEFLNKSSRYKGKVAAFSSWDVIPFIVNEKRSGVPVNGGYETATDNNLSQREIFLNELQGIIPGHWGSVRQDAFTHHYALEYMKKHQPRVVFISYGETDDFAHDGKYDEYLKAAHRTDKFIQELWQWTQSQSAYKNKTTFLITTDHGRGTVPIDSWKHHGDEIAGADQIWLAVIGPDTSSSGEQKTAVQLYQNQVAKTAAALLGVDYTNTKKTGEVITEVLSTKATTKK
jgi:hypothetical protein